MHEQSAEILLAGKEAAELFSRADASQRSSEAARLPVNTASVSCAEEAELVQRVFVLPDHEVPRVVAFCGVEQIDGAGAICTRAGLNLANQTGSPVCVVEGNFQSPSLHQYFSLDNSRGLSDAVLESGAIRDFIFSFGESKLSVLSGGSRCGKTPALWKSERLRERIAELRQEFSFVLIYGPPVRQKHIDAVLLGQLSDGVILVLESMVTRREAARAAKENLFAANVNVLGAVLNNHSFSIPETLYKRL